MRNRFVDFGAVGWLKRAAKVAGAFLIASACFAGGASAETRTLKLYNTHTKERVSITFKRNGRYLPAGLREANRFLRDWRRNEITKIDPELLDLIWEVYREVRGRDHIYVVSSYRSPATNNMLRKRSSGVARNSQHTLGKAMDFYIPGVNLARLRAAGLRKEVGGVGYYPRSGSPFVHMDTGRVRHWPKMSRSQLAKVFPNGKTLHIPSDGKPLKGYKLALAESKSGKRKSTSRPTLVASNRSSEPGARAPTTRDQNLTAPGKPIPNAEANDQPAREGSGNLFAGLFGGGNTKDNDQANRSGAVGNRTSTRTASVSPVLKNPPVPSRKVLQSEPEPQTAEPIVVASIAPGDKPLISGPVPPQPVGPAPAANTLDAQRVALESGQATASNEAIGSRFQIAASPAQKPDRGLSDAARVAAAELGLSDTGAVGSDVAASDDPVAAIAAATGTALPFPAPAPRPETTLAYASPTVTPPSLKRSLRPSVSSGDEAGLARAEPARSTSATRAQPSLSGRIPRDQIIDPMAGFASLPDKSEPTLLSGNGTTRYQTFASLIHPNQRKLKTVMMPANRFVSGGFDRAPYGALRTDRFDGGPAVVVLPVQYAR
ncbi:DUF882 domain-containing protein [Roseibium sp. HPY-6]|uniref:DUF882 domain-containing protein n=1 Tax=Roseibium sp. HPY-6 TaxID=3229852 RepID=UPI00338E7471